MQLFEDAVEPADAAPAWDAGAPLAERLRPQHWSQVVGQSHLLGPGKALRVAFESGQPHSCIFWGPPGVGKTTMARLMARAFGAHFIAMSAVLGGVKDIRDAVIEAQRARAQGRKTIVFVDEIHRFNKAQQDAFLPHVESGLIVFVGATTENPSFEVNSALMSRARVYTLRALEAPDLELLLDRALGTLPRAIVLSQEARSMLVEYADGDARRLLNTLETAAQALTPLEAVVEDQPEIGASVLRDLLGDLRRRYDKGADQFYDTISALHKAIRGSDPDAALYWLARMLDGGVDPRYLARRLIRIASEDIGLADPRALRMALDAAETFERLGSPEGELTLAQCALYLAVAPKSNAAYVAYKLALDYVRHHPTPEVPMHLRNAPTKLMQEMGAGAAYRYAHDEQDAFVAGEYYLPPEMGSPNWYQPSPRGLEAKIADKLAHLRALNEQAREKSKT